jgi:hypothetical protein
MGMVTASEMEYSQKALLEQGVIVDECGAPVRNPIRVHMISIARPPTRRYN